MATSVDGPVRRQVVAEVLGPPGAGKSTLVDAVDRAGRGVRVVKEYRSARRAPALVASGLHACRDARPWGGGDRPTLQHLRWMARLEASGYVVRDALRAGLPVVFDQGPVYTLARLSEAAGRDGGWGPRFEAWRRAKVSQLASSVDVLLVLDSRPAALLQRIRVRDKAHALDAVDDDHALSALRAQRTLYAATAAELGSLPGPRVVVLDSSRQSLHQMVVHTLGVLTESPVTRPLWRSP